MRTETEHRRQERVLHGLAVSPGIAIGPAFVSDDVNIAVPEYRVEPGAVAAELERFSAAVAFSLKQLRKLKSKATGLPGAAAEEVGYLLDAHLAMLANSRLVRGVERSISHDHINAERAVQNEIAAIAESFAAMGDAYLAARIDDIRVVGMRLVRNLTKTPFAAFQSLPEGTVILAEELTPADTALLDPGRIAGFATVLGGAESHTAIMARALNLPAVLGIAGLLTGVDPSGDVVIDGGAGLFIINPAPATLQRYADERGALGREQRRLARLRRLPAVTRDGVEITLEANLELPRELDQALAAGAQGIGLRRT
jgi:phosphoenolpyruvate-protein phosphotransferase (PTS system enzyme I)